MFTDPKTPVRATDRTKMASRLALGCVVGACIVVGFAGIALAQPDERLVTYPDLIVHNGKIFTMDDPSYSTQVGTVAEAMAIRGDEVLAVGTNDSILRLAGPKTQKIDLKGHTVTPGIINAHTHIHDGAINRWSVEAPEKSVAAFSVGGTTNAEIKRNIEVILSEKTSKLRPKEWIFLNLTNQKFIGTNFTQDKGITLAELDKLMPTHPIIVAAHPGYVMNTMAKTRLEEMYGVQPTPEEMDESGFSALGVEYRRVAVVDDYFNTRVEQLTKILEDDLYKQAAAGITTFTSHIMGARYFDAYMELVRQKRMPIRFAYTHYMGSVLNPGIEWFAARLGDMTGLGDDYFYHAGVGLGFIDSGPPMICTSFEAAEEIKKREYCRMAPGTTFSKFVYNGLKNRVRMIAGHNYGDKSADQVMDMLERLIKEEGFSLEYIRSRRFSLDHCGLYPRPDQIPRMKNLGMMLSCGSNVLTRSVPWLEKYGMQYEHWVAPVKSALDGGVKVVFETEGSIDGGLFSTFTPYITRKNARGQLISPKDAVDRNIVMKMATSWGSEYALREDRVGMLKQGMWADFIVLNKDYFTVPVEEISTIYPVITVVGGKIRYVRDDQAATFGLKPFGNQIRYNWEPGQTKKKDSETEGGF